jgi:formylmethanofuran dehydrogenase subunit E-like metal-binding protein
MKNGQKMKKFHFAGVWIAIMTLATLGVSCRSETGSEQKVFAEFDQWNAIGKMAAEKSLALMKDAAASPQKGDLIVLTNAGYAEVNGDSTQGALDGLAEITGASRGRNTLVEIHSNPWTPLWFAVFDRISGYCAYTEVDASKAAAVAQHPATPPRDVLSTATLERIDSDHVQQHSAEYQAKFDDRIFGGNEFRILTIANAIAAGAPAYVVRALEFHDHYCPGVTSGIFTVLYIRKHFPSGETGYFIHSPEPWCKEDALMVLLNATPGKKSYAVDYPSDADKSKRAPEVRDASTIVYRLNEETNRWEGLILAFEWPETSCSETGNGIVDKLCTDLWYLEHIEQYEDFIKVLKKFDLPDGMAPEDWARPGVDPLKELGLVR